MVFLYAVYWRNAKPFSTELYYFPFFQCRVSIPVPRYHLLINTRYFLFLLILMVLAGVTWSLFLGLICISLTSMC